MNQVWLWIIAGVLLILSEFVVPGVVICFFGMGAILTGVLLVFFDFSFPWQLLCAGVSGAVLLLTLRRFVPAVFKGNKADSPQDIDGDDVCGKVCRCVETISPGHDGKVEFRGSLWCARSAETIAAGEDCSVEYRENLVLNVKSNCKN